MDIKEKDINRYINLVQSHYSKEIDRVKARDELTKLCRMMAVIYRSIPQEGYQAVEKAKENEGEK